MRTAAAGPDGQWASGFVSHAVDVPLPLQLGGQVVMGDSSGIFFLILMTVFGMGWNRFWVHPQYLWRMPIKFWLVMGYT